MRIILDENLPLPIKEEIIDFHSSYEVIDVDEEYKGILDFELVEKMKKNDVLVTRDKELHKNMVRIGKKSVYYDIELENLVETQIKLYYYLHGYNNKKIHSNIQENEDIVSKPQTVLRKRFEELKKENAELKSRVNVLEGKIKSILNTANSAFED